MDLQTLLKELLAFVDAVILPFLIALALLFFFWNLVRYAILGGASEESRAKARTLMLWGVIAFFVMISIWGIVNLFVEDFGFGGDVDPITPDYMRERQGQDGPCPPDMDPGDCLQG